MPDKEWNPDEPDPIELQKEQLAIGKEFLERLKRQEAKEAEREEQMRAAPPIAGAIYKRPTASEVSEVLQKAWEATRTIMPDAPERVQLHAFQALIQAFAPPPSFGE